MTAATFPAAGLRAPLVNWQRRLVADLLTAGAAGISADVPAVKRQAGAAGLIRFLRKRGLVLLTTDRRIVVADRRGLAELLAAGDG